MKTRLLHPGTLFVTALVVTVLTIPFARMQLSRGHGEEVRQILLWRGG